VKCCLVIYIDVPIKLFPNSETYSGFKTVVPNHIISILFVFAILYISLTCEDLCLLGCHTIQPGRYQSFGGTFCLHLQDMLRQQNHPKRLSVSTSLYDVMSPKTVTFIIAMGTYIISINGHLFETHICCRRSNPTADITMTTAIFRFVCLTSYHIQKCSSNLVTCFIEKNNIFLVCYARYS
jgi:hypothetical protein